MRSVRDAMVRSTMSLPSAVAEAGRHAGEHLTDTVGGSAMRGMSDMIGNAGRPVDDAARDVAASPGGAREFSAYRGVAEQIVDDVREAAGSLLEDQRLRAADTVHSVAEALRRTAENLNRENVSLAQYADRAADRVDAFSTRVRAQRWSDLVAEAEAVAHRQPALFLAGAIAMGFIAGRFLTASAAERSDGTASSHRLATGAMSGRRDGR
jgi:hypothetical protein